MKVNYSPYLYTFDIETTSFTDSDITYTDVYLSSFFRFYFDKFVNADSIEASKDFTFCRSWTDINNFLISLNKTAKKFNRYQIIYIHNLAYEFDGLIKNCSFVRDNFDNDKALFIRSRKPAFIRCDYIEFRCSFILLNKSLHTLGNLLNYKKFSIDYKSKYFSFSVLPDIEYDYNLRDVKLTMYAVISECSKYSYINQVSDIPLTFTSFTRKQNLQINDKKTIQAYKNRNSVQKKFKHEYLNYLEKIYTGGYTHSTAYYTLKILQFVISVDITSSYPDSMINRWYPFNFHKCAPFVDNFSWFKYMIKINNDYATVYNNYRKPFKYGFFATVILKDINIKTYNKTQIPVISLSKIVNETYRAISDNGRLIKADIIELKISHVDYFLIQQFYDFELISVSELYYTSQFRPLSAFCLNCVKTYADEKSVLKKAVSASEPITKKSFYCERTKKYIFSDEEIKNLLSLSKAELYEELKKLLADSKSRLNAQYGIQVQRLYQDSYRYDVEADEYEKYIDYKLPRDLYRNFEEGLFIPAYSRLNLFMFALHILKNSKADLLYADTDSWKIYGDKDSIFSLLNEYNKNHNRLTGSDNFYKIGQFDYEQTYDYFISAGCKKYIGVIDGQIKSTIAGLPKKETEKSFNELYNKICCNDFYFFCDIAFKPNTVYHHSISGKLCSKYHKNEHYSGIVTDENNKRGIVDFENMVELVDTNYVLLSTNTISNKMYIAFLENLQGRYIDDTPTEIIKSGGEIDYNYLSSLPDDIITITEITGKED